MGILVHNHYILECDRSGCHRKAILTLPQESDLSAHVGDWAVEVYMKREAPGMRGIPEVRSVFCPDHSQADD